jgi:hypothetical protein
VGEAPEVGGGLVGFGVEVGCWAGVLVGALQFEVSALQIPDASLQVQVPDVPEGHEQVPTQLS